MSATNTFENTIINTLLKGAGLYLGLLTAVADEEASSITEVSTSGTAYARQAIDFTTSTTGATENSATQTFPVNTGSSYTVTHVGIYSASTGGSLLVVAALSASKAVATGDQFVMNAGDLDITVN